MKNKREDQTALEAEAANIDTPSGRLAELAWHPSLMHIVAANPATPGETLAKLANQKDVVVRQALAGNPNMPVQLLLRLAPEFPFEFLSNPVLPLLNLSQPDFVKNLPERSWLQFLRYDLVPAVWLKWIQQGTILPRSWQHQEMTGELAFHVAIAGETTRGWEKKAKQALQEDTRLFNYLRRANKPIFLLSILTFPGLAEHWGVELRAAPKELQALALAHSPNLSGKLLVLLARDTNFEIKCAAARHPRTPAKVLAKLVDRSTEAAVRRAVASNPYLPDKLLLRLAGDKDADVRLAVAHHPRASLNVLETLALDAEARVRAAVARHPRLSLEIYQLQASDDQPTVRAALAGNVHAPKETLLKLARDATPQVRAALARNPRLSAEGFTLLFQDKSVEVRASLMRNPRLPLPLLLQFTTNAQPGMRWSHIRHCLAANPRTPLPLLEALLQEETTREGPSTPGDKAVLLALARHPRATPAMLTILADHQAGKAETLVGVRAAVAAHSHTSVEVLRKLSAHEMLGIKRSLAANPNTPLDVLQQLLDTDDAEVWIRIAHHPAVIGDQRRILIDLLLEKTHSFLAAELPAWLLYQQQEIPEASLTTMLNSPFWRDRYTLARNPKASQPVLAVLARDGNRFVRAAARAALINRDRQIKTRQTKRGL